MTGSVRATVEEVETVRTALTRHAERVRGVADSARGDAARMRADVEAEISRRRQRLARATQETREAEIALSRCREGCGGLVQAVTAARRAQEQAQRELGDAQAAGRRFEQAAAELVATVRSAVATIEEHTSRGIARCTELIGKLTEIQASGKHANLSSVFSGALTSAQVALAITEAAADVGKVLPANTFLAPPPHQTSISQSVDDQTRHNQELYEGAKENEWFNDEARRSRDS